MTEVLTSPNVAPVAAAAAPSPPASVPRDFSRKRTPITFTIDGDVFEAAPRLPADTFVEFVTLYNDRVSADTLAQQLALLKQAIELVLLPESWERFSARLKDKARPIDDDQISDVVLWLLEEYGLRPTQPSQPASDGPTSPEPGTSSTESTQPAESTSQPSQPTAS